MLEGVASAILAKVLGDYVTGFESKNLKFSFSGELELSNLQLKRSALDGLDLPISVKSGFLSKLYLSIPWRALGSQPAIIRIEKIFVLAGPSSVASVRALLPSPPAALTTRSGCIIEPNYALCHIWCYLAVRLLSSCLFGLSSAATESNAALPIDILPSLQYDDAELERRAQAEKQRKLDLNEALKSSRREAKIRGRSSEGTQDAESDSFTKRLLTNLINSLQIYIDEVRTST
jgi:hypothetical protein